MVAAADPDADRRAVVAAKLPGLPLFDTAEEMLEAVPSDVLVVATDSPLHARLVVLGLASGRHIICEKPLSLARGEHDVVAEENRDRPDLALVAVHQYRYSPTWISISRWARLANRLSVPFKLAVEVERDGPDRDARSSWRADVSTSGGMLADHGAHFVALGWTISDDLEVLRGSRDWHPDRGERSTGIVRIGSGVLDLRVSAAASARRTSVDFRAAAMGIRWTDDSLVTSIGTSVVRRCRAEALSDRRHVDALYLSLYRDITANLHDSKWRVRLTTEALTTGAALVALLEEASRCCGVA